jgi:N-acetylmuramoyl-L-alanine amidase
LKKTFIQHRLRWGALLLLVALPGVPAHARAHHTDAWARDRFAAAERMREALNGRPPADRTRRDYQRVVNNYRNVYFGAPTSSKADPSVVAVAETLVEMGRLFDDDKILNEAIAQYKFLRREYPGSKYKCDALFTIGEIYKDDLNDPAQARAVFEDFLHRYPHNRLAEDAQQAVVDLDRQASADKKAAAHKKPGKETADRTGVKDSPNTGATEAALASKEVSGKEKGKDKETDKDNDGELKSDASQQEPADSHSSRPARVTAIRHWSTPDYTRVAIDLESEIKFGSQRIDHPDRIFFDLRNTKLASTLVGKSFDVDDGFLKKIRVAQFQPGRTRVVLEVADLSDYDAFLLPNPYRLIIDIHGKDTHGKAGNASHVLTKEQAAAWADVEAPPAASDKPDVPKSVVKADLKALAGKPVTKKEQLHNEPSPEASYEGASTPIGSSPFAPKPSELSTKSADAKAADNKVPDTKVKKVIVYADDDDDSTAEVAKAQPSSSRPHPSSSVTSAATLASTSHKSDAVTDGEAAVPEEKTDGDSQPASALKGKSHSGSTASRKAQDFDVREARPTASGDRSLIRALGLKIGKIVIDPGHGGHDTGTIGPDGLQEKDLVLEVGRRLGKLLEARLGAEVVYTRKDDTFIPLETRTAIANQQRADLFISIHANSSRDEDARGVETYYLNFTSSPEALEVAARENAVSEKSIFELQDLVKKIALKEKIEESREFAGDVQQSLHSGLAAKSPAIRDRGVKKAPFIVLIGANMPSILAEISFVSNPTDEHRLETSDYRQRIAESLYRGIAKYVNGLSGVKMASKMDKAAGQ